MLFPVLPFALRSPRRCRPACGRRPLGQALAVAALATASLAQDDHPLEAVDLSNPRGTVAGFLDEMHDIYEDFQAEGRRSRPGERTEASRKRIFRCLDLSELPPAVRLSLGKEAAVCLKETLDRIQLPPRAEWPGPDEVDAGMRKWTIPNTEISLAMFTDGPRTGEFVFTASTVDRAPDFYASVEDLAYVDRPSVTPGLYRRFVSEPGWMIPAKLIPDWAHTRVGGQALWQWGGLALTLVGALVVMASIYVVGRRRARLQHSNAMRYLLTLAFPISALLVPLAARYIVIEQLQIYGYLIVTITFAVHVVFLLALMILVVSLGNRLAELIIAKRWVKAGIDAELVRLSCRLLSIVGAVVVLLEGGQQLGISLSTLVAGAGVSGLALALAAQDSLRNILGSMMIMLDKPFRVGERVVAKGHDGFVETIGLRSTKLRLLSGHLVSIPNEELARSDIDNVSRRPYLRRTLKIELPSDQPTAKIKRALEILRGILEDHEGMDEERPPRVYLRDINERSIGIFAAYWYHPPEYWDFLAFGERVTLEMIEQFEAEGIVYSSPTVTVRLPEGSGAPGTGG